MNDRSNQTPPDPANEKQAQRDKRLDKAKKSEHAAELGDEFRQARREKGLEVTDVADELRIRRLYLKAIEEGRFGILPGTVYAIGFVRSYADFIGLDDQKTVERFRRIVGEEVESEPDLNFPIPSDESRLPGRWTILGSILVLVILYGVWSLTQPQTLPQIPTPPVNTGAENQSPSQQRNGQNGGQNSDEFDVIPEELPQIDDGNQTGSTNQALDGEVVSTTKDAEQLQNDLGADRNDGQNRDQQNAIIQTPDTTPGNQTGQENQSIANDSANTTTPQSRTKPRPVSRVTLVAVQDSWIEIRDNDGDRIVARTMEPGDQFDVPAMDNLRLLTGNAGGVKVRIDGDEVGRLGRSAEVIRNLELTPDVLRNAVVRSNSRPPR